MDAKIREKSEFFQTLQKLRSFVAHVFRPSGQVLVHVKHVSNTYRDGGNNRKRSQIRDLVRTKSLQKFEKNREFFQTFSELRSFLAHAFNAFRPSGQVLVHIKQAPNAYHEGGNNREGSRARDLVRAKSLQKIEKNHEFFQTLSELRSFVAHAFRPSGQVLVHVKHASNTYRQGGNNRERSQTRDLVRPKSLQ